MLKEGCRQLQRYSTFCDNKRNVEWLLKQSLKAFKRIQHRSIFDSTCFNAIEGAGAIHFNIAVQQNRTDVEAVFPGLYMKLNTVIFTAKYGRKHLCVYKGLCDPVLVTHKVFLW